MRDSVMKPPIPKDEEARIAALQRYRILDTLPEERFDRITRLASQIFGTSIALVSLVDTDRQWFKSRVGLDATETPREDAFCAHAIHSDTPMVVNDTHDDARFRDNPLVLGGPRIRFYCGAPLITPDHRRLGTLCIIDDKPREMSEPERAMLIDLARIVIDELEFRHAAVELDGRLQQLELIEEIGNIGHWWLDEHGWVHCSPQVQKILDLNLDAMTSDAFLAHVFHKDQDAARKELEGEGCVRSRVRLAGSAKSVEIVGRRQGVNVVGIFQDITEQQNLERRVRQSEKMATVGTLVAGIGHEINNPLSCIKANADVLLEELDELAGVSPSARLAELRDLTDDIRDGSRRIHRIVQGLQSFSRSADKRQEVVELERVLRIAGRLCVHEVRHKAALVFDTSEASLALGDESQLVQVAVNLLTNAAHSISPSALSANNVVARCGIAGEGRVFFEVEDSGSGMSPAVVDRAFDPFFTTKPQGVGTGLGLSISRGIVLSMNGSIDVQSVEGIGTRIRVELPAASVSASARPTSPSSPPAADAQTPASVLIIDDEPAVGRALSRVLRMYTVSVEVDARQALHQLKKGETADAILCDLMMPSMTGADFFTELKTARPDLVPKTAFITGGAFTPQGRSFFESVDVPVLTKPVDIDELRVLVAKLVSKA